MMRSNTLQRTALLISLTLVFQSLRFFIPIPPPVSMFLIGSLVNTCLVLGVLAINYRAAVLVSLSTPCIAYLQGQLPFFPFIFPVAVGNICFVTAIYCLKNRAKWVMLGISAFIKVVALYGSFSLLFGIMNFPLTVQVAILFSMSWPQLVTGLIGGMLALTVYKRIKTSL